MAVAAPPTLQAHNLIRRHGSHQTVRGITLQLHRGEVLALLGHNGAGKSTTLQMLTGVLRPDSGHIEVCGIDLAREPERARACIGFLPEIPPLYREMTVDDYLRFAARLRRLHADKLSAALAHTKQRCGLEMVGRQLIGTLSKGYQQRVGIAQAIIHSPQVIVLDEPTVGLDPSQIRDIRALIRELGDAHSVILSTHLLNEAEALCDRVEIMQNGRLVFGDANDTLSSFRQPVGFVVTLRKPPALETLAAIPGVQHVEALDEVRFKVLHSPDDAPGAALLALAAQHGWQAEQLSPLQRTLEDVYVQVTEAQREEGNAP